MNINISGNLKRLRRERGVTQEDLAGFIGVSFQAVSKWERGDGYPDITLLPVIANYFNVSLDELCGMDELRNSDKREEIMRKVNEYGSKGNIKECIETLREGLKYFPNDYAIMAKLAGYLDLFGESDEERRTNSEEAVKLYERVLNYCPDIKLKNFVQGDLAYALKHIGEFERGKKIAEQLPILYKTREMKEPMFLEGDERVKANQLGIERLGYCFFSLVLDMVRHGNYSNEEKINLLEKPAALYKIIYDKGDFVFQNIQLHRIYDMISDILIESERYDEAMEVLEKAAEYAVAYDTLQPYIKHISPAVNMLDYNKLETSTNSKHNKCWHMLDVMHNHDLYAPLRDSGNKQFKAIIDKISEYAE